MSKIHAKSATEYNQGFIKSKGGNNIPKITLTLDFQSYATLS